MNKFFIMLFVALIFLIPNGCSDNNPLPPTHDDIEFLKASGLSLPSKYEILFFRNNKFKGIEFNVTCLLYSQEPFLYPPSASYSERAALETLIPSDEIVNHIRKFMTYSQRRKYPCTVKELSDYRQYYWNNTDFNFSSLYLKMNKGQTFILLKISKNPDSENP